MSNSEALRALEKSLENAESEESTAFEIEEGSVSKPTDDPRLQEREDETMMQGVCLPFTPHLDSYF